MEAATAPGGSPCSGQQSANATATAFHYAMDFVRVFLPQISYVFQRQAVFFVLCEKLDALTQENWAEGVPIPDFDQEVLQITASSLGAHLPCLFGWVAALVCELRVQQDVLNGLWDAHLELFLKRSVPNLSRLEAAEDGWMDEREEILGALRAKDHRGIARLQSRGRWILRDLLHGGHRGLSLLDSSGWAQLPHVLEVLPAGERGPACEGAAFALQHTFLGQVTRMMVARSEEGLFARSEGLALKVWAASSHPTLLLEPLSLWKQAFLMDILLSTSQCLDELPDVPCDEALRDLFSRLGSRDDGLGHFPFWLMTLKNFRGFLQSLRAIK